MLLDLSFMAIQWYEITHLNEALFFWLEGDFRKAEHTLDAELYSLIGLYSCEEHYNRKGKFKASQRENQGWIGERLKMQKNE